VDLKRVLFVILLLGLACNDITNESNGPLIFDTPPVADQKLHVIVSEPDRIFVEHPPVMVGGGGAEFIYRDTLVLEIGGRTVREVFVFHGLDRGDIVEMDTNLALDGVPIFLRSEHKEDLNAFNSWTSKHVDVPGYVLRINIKCGVTGVNTILNRFAARSHWGIWITFE
jgi:hypothetical protein